MADKSFKVKNGIQIGTTTEVTSIVDEDNMASNSATALSTQQSIKAYVDAQVATKDTFLELGDTQSSFTASAVVGVNAAGNAVENTELLVTASSNDVTLKNGSSDKDLIFVVNDGGSATEVARFDADVSALKMASGKQLQLGAAEEHISGDGTDISFAVGANGDINIPADIGLTFGNDGEKIEGDGTDLTITGAKINLSPTTDVHIPNDKGIVFGDAGEKIEGDGTNLTIASSGALSIANTGLATFTGAVQINGNLTTLGSQTVLETTTTEIEDNLIAINSKNSGGADLDSGIHINRGSTGNNAVFYWNEGDDKFKAVLSTSASTATAVTDSSAAVIVATFEGNITGDVTGDCSGNSATATVGTSVTASANNSTDETCFPTFVDGATGTQGIETDTGFTYNPNSGTLTSTIFAGAATTVNTQSRSTDAAHYLTFVTDNNGSATAEGLFTDAGIAYNPSGNLLTTTVTAARYSDLAEVFPTVDGLVIEPGTVVCFTGDKKVGTCDIDACPKVAGIVSTKPGLLMNVEGDGVDLALTGRVPVKVTGDINAGDLLVSAGSGRARAESNPAVGTVIGKAIESHSGGDGVIDAFAMMM